MTEKAQLLKNMFGMSGRSGSHDERDVHLSAYAEPVHLMRTVHDSSRGFAFSQEEGGVVSQSQLIRQYDTTEAKPSGT